MNVIMAYHMSQYYIMIHVLLNVLPLVKYECIRPSGTVKHNLMIVNTKMLKPSFEHDELK